MSDVETVGGVSFLLVLSAAMFIGSYLAGQIPLVMNLSESRLRTITIFGAGLLVGTALSVIVPEGVEAVYAAQRDFSVLPAHDLHVSHEAKSLLEDEHKGPPDVPRLIPKDANLNEGLAPPNSVEAKIAKREVSRRVKRGVIREEEEKDDHDHDNEGVKHEESGHSHSHSHGHGNVHSTIGYSLVFGFIFMLLVDQIGSMTINRGERSGRVRMSISATIGLVVHAAADGIALGSASAINKSSVQMIVFLAIILHKAPSSFGLVSFLLMEGLDKARVRKHLLIFSLAAPIGALVTFFVLVTYANDASPSQSMATTGVLMLFSAGTFLYVATVHVLPELTQHGTGPRDYTLVDAQAPSTAGHSHSGGPSFTMRELGAIIVGAIVPAILASGHSH
ncbi:hypothetical protein PENTCL1PPCAC_3374 [Pristionchus entomophagus]|uniref:Uncharacterized protein n=1 Tax=Pristionchus entomophagus TaxID=358040 RepID=A0AAV5SEB8_9BILA|nr:hypothetical protein PENTCL1PPCAC_3374 [Pristionchus entomophagus]